VSTANRDICEKFGDRLRKLRESRGWTQTDMAVHLGMDRSFISDLERGKREPCLRSLEIIADGFQTSLPKLLSRLK
jgi:transcriptional regulator with XRE-family HTH domain